MRQTAGPVDIEQVHDADQRIVGQVLDREGRALAALVGEDAVVPGLLHLLGDREAVTEDSVAHGRIVEGRTAMIDHDVVLAPGGDVRDVEVRSAQRANRLRRHPPRLELAR